MKTNTTPPQHPDLQHFQTELYDLIRTIQFPPFKSQFQQRMKKDLTNLKTGNNVVVEAENTTNLHKVSVTKLTESSSSTMSPRIIKSQQRANNLK